MTDPSSFPAVPNCWSLKLAERLLNLGNWPIKRMFFYYSGHGLPLGQLTPTAGVAVPPEAVRWNHEMQVAIIAGCSVLDINDYNGHGLYVVAPGALTPGERWNNTGPQFLLGYNHSAPTDAQNSDAIVAAWAANRASQGDAMAWMNANNNANGRNACAIEKNTAYYYFKEVSFLGVAIRYDLTIVPASAW